MKWSVPPIWEGGDVWIIGGGSSIPKQFGIPDKVVEEVVKGTSQPSVYSPYMLPLHNKHVIGINVAYLIGNWIDMVFFGDSNFLRAHKERLAEWPGLKVSCYDPTDIVPWIKYLPKDPHRPRGISNNPRMVSWNANSGSAAISVAANAGAKRIILLGFDMNLGNNNAKHWHNMYKDAVITEPERKRRERGEIPVQPFAKHLKGFSAIAKDAKVRGIEILNANPDSAINEFPKYTVKELLNES